MFDNKTKSIVEAVSKVLGVNEDIDPKKRTKDTLKGADEPTKQKDDVGPGSDGKSTKVKYRPGPLATEGFKDKLFNSLKEEKLDEASEDMLARYMKSRGYNPETTTKDKKIAITKSNEFKKWLNDHQFEETQYENEDYSEEQLDEMINEVLSKDATAGDWIHDFVHSKNPKFEGKSKKKRQQMALAAYYAKQRNEEAELDLDEAEPFFQEELEQFMQSEEFSELDEDTQSELMSYLFDENTEPKSDKEKKLASLAHPKNKITFKDVLVGRGVLKKEEAELEESKMNSSVEKATWAHERGDHRQRDYHIRDAISKTKNKKFANAMHQAYAMNDIGDWRGKDHYLKVADSHATKPKHKNFIDKFKQMTSEEVGLEEGKRPETDSDVPWVGGSEPAQPDVKDKGTSGTHTPMSRAKHLARVALKKVKKEVVGEEVEQIDELSKDTLKSYIQKTKDPERKGSLANIISKQGFKGKQSPEFKKRFAWQKKAVDKWWDTGVKEEFEQIDETQNEEQSSTIIQEKVPLNPRIKGPRPYQRGDDPKWDEFQDSINKHIAKTSDADYEDYKKRSEKMKKKLRKNHEKGWPNSYGVSKEEIEQVEEGAFSSGALKLTPQGKKKFDALHKSIKSTSTIRDKDEKGTYTSVRVKPAGETEYKEISRKYDKE